MIDIIIIVAYIAAGLKIALMFFQWFEEKFNVHGKIVDEVVEEKKEDVAAVSG